MKHGGGRTGNDLPLITKLLGIGFEALSSLPGPREDKAFGGLWEMFSCYLGDDGGLRKH